MTPSVFRLIPYKLRIHFLCATGFDLRARVTAQRKCVNHRATKTGGGQNICFSQQLSQVTKSINISSLQSLSPGEEMVDSGATKPQKQHRALKPIWHSGQTVELQPVGLSHDAMGPKDFPIDLHCERDACKSVGTYFWESQPRWNDSFHDQGLIHSVW